MALVCMVRSKQGETCSRELAGHCTEPRGHDPKCFRQHHSFRLLGGYDMRFLASVGMRWDG